MDKETIHAPSPTPTPICLNSITKYIPTPMYSPTCSGMFD